METDFWFTSTLFNVVSGEDKETNPGMYGKELGQWLCIQLEAKGYDRVHLIPEDWGWCVMCSQENFLLWVGCGAVLGNGDDSAYLQLPDAQKIVWHLFPRVEIPFYNVYAHFKRLLGKLDTEQEFEKLRSNVEKILLDEPAVTVCGPP